MSRIDEFIKEKCPNGVEYDKIKNFAEVGTGNSNRNEAIENGIYPFYVRSKDVFKIDKYEYDEEAIVIPGEGGIGEIFHYVKGKYALHQRAYRIHIFDKKIETKYLYYYMFNFFKKFILSKAVSATVTSIRKPMIEDFIVAIPPIEVQEEIVRILDKFGDLEAELETELEARKRQCEFFRTKIMQLGNISYKTMPLSEIYKFKYGTGNTIPEIAGNYPVYGSNGIVGTHNQYNSEDAPVIGHIGAYAGIVNWATGKHFVTYNGVICNKINEQVDNRYAYYLLLNEDFLSEQKGAQPFVSYDSLNKPIVKVPNIEEQKRIVNILDKFDKLVNDISEGLPAEIEARKKQYEYYRNKLLSFEELKING